MASLKQVERVIAAVLGLAFCSLVGLVWLVTAPCWLAFLVTAMSTLAFSILFALFIHPPDMPVP